MARCNNDVLLKKIGVNKIDKNKEVDFTILDYLNDCRRIIASKFVYVTGTVNYDAYAKPEDAFECMPQGCTTSGTLFNTSTTDKATVVYKESSDATEFANGVLTLYATKLPVTVKLSDASDFTNADVYEVTEASKGKDNYYAIAIDLSKAPTSVDGTGWEAKNTGAYISVEFEAESGISTISIFESMEDFEINDVVKIACLTDLSGTIDIPVDDATCWNNGYNPDDITIERTITGKALTPNYWKLNPMLGKGEKTQSFDIKSREFVVEASDPAGYGRVVLGDYSEEECGYVAIQLADSCDTTDAQLVRISVPNLVDLDKKHFQVIDNGTGGKTLYVSQDYIGQKVIISYPVDAEVEQLVANENFIGSRRVRMSWTEEQTDGVKWRYSYNNVLVTSFPQAITDGETEFSFTISIQKDNNGNYYEKNRIL